MQEKWLTWAPIAVRELRVRPVWVHLLFRIEVSNQAFKFRKNFGNQIRSVLQSSTSTIIKESVACYVTSFHNKIPNTNLSNCMLVWKVARFFCKSKRIEVAWPLFKLQILKKGKQSICNWSIYIWYLVTHVNSQAGLKSKCWSWNNSWQTFWL